VSVVSAPPGSGKTVFVGRGESDGFFRGQPEELMQHPTTVLYDSQVPLLEADSPAGARQEDRAGAAPAVIWTTRGPVNNDDPSDTALRQVGTADSDGVAGSAA
jgi:hypothetical protein